MTDIIITDKTLARIIERVAQKTLQSGKLNKSSLLNIAACEIVGPGHDWGLIKNHAQPVKDKDIEAGEFFAKSAKNASTIKTIMNVGDEDASEITAYVHEMKFSLISKEKISDNQLTLDDVLDMIDGGEGDIIPGSFETNSVPLDKEQTLLICQEQGLSSWFSEPLTREYIMEVACLVSFDELDEEDLDIYGECAVDGQYKITVNLESPVSDEEIESFVHDVFNDTVAIHDLDNYHFTVRRATANDEPSSIRSDLGWVTLSDNVLREYRSETGGFPGL